jgi:hypothetical protein
VIGVDAGGHVPDVVELQYVEAVRTRSVGLDVQVRRPRLLDEDQQGTAREVAAIPCPGHLIGAELGLAVVPQRREPPGRVAGSGRTRERLGMDVARLPLGVGADGPDDEHQQQQSGNGLEEDLHRGLLTLRSQSIRVIPRGNLNDKEAP